MHNKLQHLQSHRIEGRMNIAPMCSEEFDNLNKTFNHTHLKSIKNTIDAHNDALKKIVEFMDTSYTTINKTIEALNEKKRSIEYTYTKMINKLQSNRANILNLRNVHESVNWQNVNCKTISDANQRNAFDCVEVTLELDEDNINHLEKINNKIMEYPDPTSTLKLNHSDKLSGKKTKRKND
jgi:hypothetical protein